MPKEFSAFLSVPMTALAPDEYQRVTAAMHSIHAAITARYPSPCFCMPLTVDKAGDVTPAEAYINSVTPLAVSNAFILILPQKAYTSAIFEAGFAAALNIPAIYFVRSRADLPYMMREADKVPQLKTQVITFTDYTEIVQHINAGLLDNLLKVADHG